MANLFDFLDWRGDLRMHLLPPGDADALALSAICYLDLGDPCRTPAGQTIAEAAPRIPLVPDAPKPHLVLRPKLLRAMAQCERYAGARLCNYVNIEDSTRGIQFSAVCCDLMGVGRAVCFRGTNATLVGWREDFAMSYDIVPAQRAAARYLQEVAAGSAGPLWLIGHSKGGNLAVFAAAMADPAIQDRIRLIWCFDGPGLREDICESEGYQRIRSRIRAIIPQSSVIGLLMGGHPSYIVVQSEASGLAQHDTFSWPLLPPGKLIAAEETTFSSQLMDRTLRSWLATASPEQRRAFLDAVFHILESTGASTTAEMKANILKQLPQMAQTLGSFDPETRQMLIQLASRFVAMTTVNAVDLGVGQASGGILRFLRGEKNPGGESHE